MNDTWLHDPASCTNCTVIGEVAQAHDGSLGMAHAYIDAIADAGADAVKFQTHIASAESTPAEPWRVRFSRQDETRYDYWKRMEFTPEQWHGLKQHADERGLLFLSSPFSLQAFELLREVGVAGWKLASGELGSNDKTGGTRPDHTDLGRGDAFVAHPICVDQHCLDPLGCLEPILSGRQEEAFRGVLCID